MRSITNRLSDWVLKYRIPHVAVKDLLKHVLPVRPGELDEINTLPLDPRTFLGTSTNIVLRPVNPGHYFHVGIEKAIQTLFRRLGIRSCNLEVKVAINIDGLPLFHSSNGQFYPILCSVENIRVLVGIYYGNEKPRDTNDFLLEFVQEATYLIKNGIKLFENMHKFIITKMLFDAVAKAQFLPIKGHSGYYSCTKCRQKGDYVRDRVCFPEIDFQKRTHEDFLDEINNNENQKSILLEIPGMNFVTNIPLDYMHLVCLGVVRKLIVNIWVFGKPPHKLSAGQTEAISRLLAICKDFIPSEFARRPRHLNECKRFKATEFRQILFYTGIVVFKNVLSNDMYSHFITLHVALTAQISQHNEQKKF
ncbi:hypothetical protein MML48_10g00020724 [Holotrichia oblita]|uniref:Uncharacterized protein n=1 Tax=Holotrichia oblita TaxID=644536 RepID=A0ACB9SHY8_HOLOL|nr:hypothetical protein MML48_10g00020724 [Holotrichia oblita]